MMRTRSRVSSSSACCSSVSGGTATCSASSSVVAISRSAWKPTVAEVPPSVCAAFSACADTARSGCARQSAKSRASTRSSSSVSPR